MNISSGDDAGPDVHGTVLLVESDPRIVTAATLLLSTEGYEVAHVAGVPEAQQFIHNALESGRPAPALVLLGDLGDQTQVIELLDTVEAVPGVQPHMILFTDASRSRLADMHHRIRALSIIVNPHDTEALLRIAKAVLGHHSGTGETGPL